MDWTLLGIEPTKDKAAIRSAYRARLRLVNPEDKPEEFKALRAVYEEATRLADVEEKEEILNESPLEIWKTKLRTLYDDFEGRIRPQNWKKLLNDDICMALDKRPCAEEVLLRFLMEDYFLPQAVWQTLDGVFCWSERKDELYEKYPRDFIDYAVLNGINIEENLPYELFKPGKNAKDCDEYRKIYYKIHRSEASEIEPLLEKLDGLSEWHPYGEIVRLRLISEKGEKERAFEGYRHLASEYPDDALLVLSFAAQCMRSESCDEAERLISHILEINPSNMNAKRLLADCLEKLGKEEDAKEVVFDLMRECGGDQKQLYLLGQTVNRLNEAVIARKEAEFNADPSNDKNAIELAWCYLQNDRGKEALKLCEGVSPDYEEQYDYHNLCAKVNYASDNFKEALEHLVTVEKILRATKPDGTEKTAKRIKRLPEMLQMQGSCLFALERKDEGLKKYEEALLMAPDDAEVLTKTAHILRAEKNYSRAVEVLERLIRVLPNGYHGYLLLAANLFDLHRNRDALDAVNRSIELDGGDLGAYILKIRIFIRNGVWDGAEDTVKYVREHGVTDDISLMWCEGQIAEFYHKDSMKALKIYEEIARRFEEGEYFALGEKLYFRLTVLTANSLDMRNSEDRDRLLKLLEKGLSCDSDDPDCLDYKAWLLKRDKKYKESLEIYLKLEKLPRRDMSVEREIAEIYYSNLAENAEKALEYYRKLIANSEEADFYFYSGTCLRYLRRFDEAEKDFLREQELKPDDVDGYNGLAYVYEAMGRFEDALFQVERAISRVSTREGDQSRFSMHKLRILRRLSRPEEAIELIDATAAKYGLANAEKLKFDVFCQFGMWKEAEKLLFSWKWSRKNREELAACEIRYELYRGRGDKAEKAFRKLSARLGSSDREELGFAVAEAGGNLPEAIVLLKKRLSSVREKSRELIDLARIYRRLGEKENMIKCAETALALLDRVLSRNTVDEALYRGRRSIVLALLGREAEARSELERARELPLCEHCDYCRCKDADVYKALIEEIFGNEELAKELDIAGEKNWPDETDFYIQKRYLERKGL